MLLMDGSYLSKLNVPRNVLAAKANAWMFEKRSMWWGLDRNLFCCRITSRARAPILQVKAQRAFAAEGASGVDAGGVGRARLLLTLIHI